MEENGKKEKGKGKGHGHYKPVPNFLKYTVYEIASHFFSYFFA